MSERRITVKPTHERYSSKVRKNGYKRTLPEFDPKKFDPLPDDIAEEIFKMQAVERDQDRKKIAEIVFLHGNELWRKKPDKYDVLGLDAKNVPEYKKIPESGYPNQIIRVKRGGKWNYYKCNRNGLFRKTFPPSAKKYQNLELKEEIRTYEKMLEDPNYKDKEQLKGMIKARKHQVEIDERIVKENTKSLDIKKHLENKERVRKLLRQRRTISRYDLEYKEINELINALERENIRIEKRHKIYPFDRKKRKNQ